MADSWFVSPDTVRIDLEGGEWIEVKKELSVREERSIMLSAVKSFRRGEDGQDEFYLDKDKVSFAKVAAYLVDWSLKGANGKSVPCTPDNLGKMKGDKYRLIADAVEAHAENGDAASADDPSSETASPATLPSVAS